MCFTGVVMGRIQIRDEQLITSSARSQEAGLESTYGRVRFAEGTRPEVPRYPRPDSRPPRSRPSVQLNLLYQYRRLVSRHGRELDVEQKERLRTLESLFVASSPGSRSRSGHHGAAVAARAARPGPAPATTSPATTSGDDFAELETPSFRQLEQIDALLRESAVCQPVKVIALGLQNAICLAPDGASSESSDPEDGAEVELIFEDDASGSYRFKARVAWSQPDLRSNTDRLVGLEFCGAPLLLRKGPPSDKTHSIVEQMLDDRRGR